MFTHADMKYFAHPVPHHTAGVKRVLVTATRYGARDHTYLNKIVEVRPKVSVDYGRLWYTTTGGDVVAGLPVNPTELSVGGWAVGTTPAYPDLFFVGRGRVMQTGDSAVFSLTGEVHRSDGARREDRSDWKGVVLTTWLHAAEYGAGLLARVRPGIDEGALRSLVAERWEFNRALAIIEAEGVGRGWGDNLEGLHADIDWLPRYAGSMHHSVTAMIPAGTAPVSAPDAVTQYHTLASGVRGTASVSDTPAGAAFLTLPMNLVVSTDGEPIIKGALPTTPPTRIVQEIRNQYGVWDVTYNPASASAYPFVNGVHRDSELV